MATTLDANRHPTLNVANAAAACMSTPENFSDWYTNDANNFTVVGDIILFDNDNNGYVNRFGALGEQFQGVVPNTERGGGLNLAECTATCQVARIPDQYGFTGFPFEQTLFPGQADDNHNFYFTTEVNTGLSTSRPSKRP